MELEADQRVSRVTEYAFTRSDGNVRIRVHSVLFGEGAGLFVAVPTTPLGETTGNHELHITADTEEAALEACVKAISGLSKSEIFPKT